MADLLGRAYKVGKAYLDAARERLEDIDARAQEELSRSLPREGGSPSVPPTPISASANADDPFARAAAKIAAAQQLAAATAPPAPPADPVTTAYKIIGLPLGSDYLTVESAVNKLRARTAPTRFPDGSTEQAEAQVILQRVEEAFTVLKNALGPASGGRFDKLEL